MDELKSLTEIIRHKSQRSIQLVNQNFRKKETSKDNLLFKGLISEDFTSDEEASRKLFNADPGNRNYRNTKAKLKRKLLNHLYFLDYKKSDYTLFQAANYECLHGLHQAKILYMENNSCMASRRLPAIIKLSKEFELIEIELEALLLLRRDYANKGKCTPLIQTAAEIEEIKPFHRDIMISEELYYETMVLINKSATSCEKIMAEIPERIDRIQFLAKKHNSKRLDILSQKLTIAYNNVNKDHLSNIDVCNYLEKKYLSKKMSDIRVNLNYRDIAQLKLVSLFNENRLDEAISYAQDLQSLYKVGSEEWFLFKEYQFLSLMKMEKYSQATKVFRTIRMNKQYSGLPVELIDRWTIYRAYLLFVNDSKLIKWGFDIDEFKLEKAEDDKDYNGYKIAKLLIQFMFYFRDADTRKVTEKIEELSALSSTHLDKRHNYRNSIFIRMLEIVEKNEFNVESIEEKASNYQSKLESTPIPPDLHHELEIIPFEKMWEYVLNILKTNKFYLHYRFYHLHEVE